jgi:hypothetical protein
MSRRVKKIEPATQTLLFKSPAVAAATASHFIDLSQCASLVNRRFYRQGINWAVSSIRIFSRTFSGQVVVSKLPETWTMSNSWEKGMRAWLRMVNEAMDETQSVRPKFMDFKVYADADHHTAGFAANLLPISTQVGSTTTAGEWQPSKMVIPNTPPTFGVSLEREIVAVGQNYPGASAASTLDAVSLIEGYASSRGLPNVLDPNTPDDAESVDGALPENWIQAVFNDGLDQDAEVIDDMREDNNIAPYPFENDGVNTDTMYPGGANQLQGLQIHSYELLTATTVGGQTHVKGGMFPCGLIKIDAAPDAGTVPELFIQVDLVPCHHRGYLCEPMTDM